MSARFSGEAHVDAGSGVGLLGSAPVKAGWLDSGYLARAFGEAAGRWAQAQLSPETYLAATSVAAAIGLVMILLKDLVLIHLH